MARGLTLRAVLAGLFIGVFICLSNTYYGLQIGVASQMSMVSSLLGYVGFRLFSKYLSVPFTPAENVLVVSVATATGCMTVTAGVIGALPALEYLIGPGESGPLHLSVVSLLLWSSGLCLFGLIFASLLREYFIEQENLPWPGAKATAQLINTLHHRPDNNQTTAHNDDRHDVQWRHKASILTWGAVTSASLSVCMYFLPILRQVPVFGPGAAEIWLWSIDLAPGLIGQGIITGLAIPLHMLVGTIVGWAILSPYAKHRGWAPGHVDDWETGSRGWIIWVSLAALLADASVKLAWTTLKPACQSIAAHPVVQRRLALLWGTVVGRQTATTPLNNVYMSVPHDDQLSDTDMHDDNSGEPMVPQPKPTRPVRYSTLSLVLVVALVASVLYTAAAVNAVFGDAMQWHYTILAIFLSLPMAVVGIRSLAETDYNPQSALVSQLAIAALTPSSHPNAVIINIVFAAIAQAGANQAGDLSYDFKVGHLIGVRQDVQIPGQIIGSLFGVFVSCGMYKLYASQYPIPGRLFQVPSAFVLLSTAKLLLGRGLPEGVAPFAFWAAVLSMVSTIVKMRYSSRWWQNLIPSGVSFAIGIYNTPSFTITRAVGGLVYYVYKKRNKEGGNIHVLASGMILGESIASLVTLALNAMNTPRVGQ